MDSSLPDSFVHGILQAIILEWLPCPPPGDLPHPGIKPRSLALQEDSEPSEPLRKPKVSGSEIGKIGLICMAESFCCSPEVITLLVTWLYSNTK